MIYLQHLFIFYLQLYISIIIMLSTRTSKVDVMRHVSICS